MLCAEFLAVRWPVILWLQVGRASHKVDALSALDNCIHYSLRGALPPLPGADWILRLRLRLAQNDNIRGIAFGDRPDIGLGLETGERRSHGDIFEMLLKPLKHWQKQAKHRSLAVIVPR